MKMLLRVSAALLMCGSVLGAAPNITDFMIKGAQVIKGLQEYNFELQYNIFTRNGAQTTIQAVQDMRQYVSTFAASGVSVAYSELYETNAVYESIRYLNDKFAWSRLNYVNLFNAALSSSDCFHKLEYASQKIEGAMDSLYNYTDAKENNPSSDRIEAAKKAFIAKCANGACEDAVRFAVQAFNGGDLNSANKGFGCDVSEAIAKGAPDS